MTDSNPPAPDTTTSGDKNTQQGKKKFVPYRNRFEGREPELKGFIYDLTKERSSYRYTRTTKEISNYVGRTYKKHSRIFAEALINLNLVRPTEPAVPDPDDVIQLELWKQARRTYKEQDQACDDFLANLYHVIHGQCTEALQDRIKSHPHFLVAQGNGIELLRIIKAISYSFEDGRDTADAMLQLKKRFYSFHQTKGMTLLKYHELFLDQVSVLEEVGVTLYDQGLANQIAAEAGRADPVAQDYIAAKERALAIQFVCGAADKHRGYLRDIHNNRLNGDDNYPQTVQAAYNVMNLRDYDEPSPFKGRDGVAFAQNGEPGPNPRGRRAPVCFNCGQPGHYANNCPAKQDSNNNQG